MSAMLVSEVMTRKPASIREYESLSRAREIMFDLKVHHLPVVHGDGRLAGILSTHDLIRAATSSTDATVAASQLGDVMTRHVVSVGPDTPLRDAAELLAQGSFHALPVVDAEARLTGIMTSTDLIRLLIDRL